MLCYSLFSGSVFKTKTEIGLGHSTLLAVMDGFGDVQNGLEDVPPFTETFVPACIEVNGTQYRPCMTVFLSYTADGEPLFGLVKNICVFDHSIKLVVQKWETVSRGIFLPMDLLFAVDTCSLLHTLHAVNSYTDNNSCLYCVFHLDTESFKILCLLKKDM